MSFTLLALGVYLWLAMSDSIESAHTQAGLQADAVSSAITRLYLTGSPPTSAEFGVARTLGVEALQILDQDGQVTISLGNLDGASASVPAEVGEGGLVPVEGQEVRIANGGFSPMAVGTLDLFRGGEYGAVFVYPGSQDGDIGGLRVILSYHGIVHDAQTLLFRSIALTGGILAVAVAAMWVLLTRFVARPLREYSNIASRIAMGEPLRMPDLGTNELGQLGQAINSMAEILRHEATVDALTGLYNMRDLSHRLEDFLEEARQNSEPLSLVVCDLDNLKPVNDRYGHQTGDVLLKEVARRLLDWAGLDYTCWRTGGDEFAAMIPRLPLEEAEREVAALEAAINHASIIVPGGRFSISVSVGIASYPADGETGAALLHTADLRMYKSKSLKSLARPSAPAA